MSPMEDDTLLNETGTKTHVNALTVLVYQGKLRCRNIQLLLEHFLQSTRWCHKWDFCQQINSLYSGVRNKLGLKLQLHSLEVAEVNLFCLLMMHVLEAIIEYRNEAMVSKRLLPTYPGESWCFLWTLFLSLAFNLSLRTAWMLMHSLAIREVMPRECYVQILSNLQGY